MVISTHLPPPVMIDSAADLELITHILCCSWAMCFSAAASSENDHGSMNLASNTASVFNHAVQRRRHPAIHRVVNSTLNVRDGSGSVTTPSWTTRLSERSSGSISPRFSRHRRGSLGARLAMCTYGWYSTP